jgi:hypothetical protein
MASNHKIKLIVGWVLHALIAGMMIMAGSTSVFGLASKEMLEQTAKYGLAGQMTMIGVGQLVSAVLLLVPRTLSLGLLLTSAFWGGTICLHMSHGESYIFQSVLLVLTWVGAYLRDPRTMASIHADPKTIS